MFQPTFRVTRIRNLSMRVQNKDLDPHFDGFGISFWFRFEVWSNKSSSLRSIGDTRSLCFASPDHRPQRAAVLLQPRHGGDQLDRACSAGGIAGRRLAAGLGAADGPLQRQETAGPKVTKRFLRLKRYPQQGVLRTFIEGSLDGASVVQRLTRS